MQTNEPFLLSSNEKIYENQKAISISPINNLESLKIVKQKIAARNKITEDLIKLTKNTENLNTIEILNMNRECMQTMPTIQIINGLSNLMNLRELDISNHEIEKIENLNNLKKLRYLNLSHNRITKIENLTALKNLEILNLSNNFIQEIPTLLTKNSNLIELHIASNGIIKKENIINLKSLKKLKNLDLEGNPITNYSDYKVFVITNLKQLKKLDKKILDSNNKKSISINDQIVKNAAEMNTIVTESSFSDIKKLSNLQHFASLNLSASPSHIKTIYIDSINEGDDKKQENKKNNHQQLDETREFNMLIDTNSTNDEGLKLSSNLTIDTNCDSNFMSTERIDYISRRFQDQNNYIAKNMAQIRCILEKILHQNKLKLINLLPLRRNSENFNDSINIITRSGEKMNNNIQLNSSGPTSNEDISRQKNIEVDCLLDSSSKNDDNQYPIPSNIYLNRHEQNLLSEKANNILIGQLHIERGKIKGKSNEIIKKWDEIKNQLDINLERFEDITGKIQVMIQVFQELLENTILQVANLESKQIKSNTNQLQSQSINERKELLEKMKEYIRVIANEPGLQFDYILQMLKLILDNYDENQAAEITNNEKMLRECENKHNTCAVICLQVNNIETYIKTKSIEIKSKKLVGETLHNDDKDYHEFKSNLKILRKAFHELEKNINIKFELFIELQTLIKMLWKYNVLKNQCMQNDQKINENIRIFQQKISKASKSPNKGDTIQKNNDQNKIKEFKVKNITPTKIENPEFFTSPLTEISQKSKNQTSTQTDIFGSPSMGSLHENKNQQINRVITKSNKDILKNLIKKSPILAPVKSSASSQQSGLSLANFFISPNQNQHQEVRAFTTRPFDCEKSYEKSCPNDTFDTNNMKLHISKINITKFPKEILSQEGKINTTIKDEGVTSICKQAGDVLVKNNIERKNSTKCSNCDIQNESIKQLLNELAIAKNMNDNNQKQIEILKEELDNTKKNNDKYLKCVIANYQLQINSLEDDRTNILNILEYIRQHNQNINEKLKKSLERINQSINKFDKDISKQNWNSMSLKWVINAQASTIEFLMAEKKISSDHTNQKILEIEKLLRTKYEKYSTFSGVENNASSLDLEKTRFFNNDTSLCPESKPMNNIFSISDRNSLIITNPIQTQENNSRLITSDSTFYSQLKVINDIEEKTNSIKDKYFAIAKTPTKQDLISPHEPFLNGNMKGSENQQKISFSSNCQKKLNYENYNLISSQLINEHSLATTLNRDSIGENTNQALKSKQQTLMNVTNLRNNDELINKSQPLSLTEKKKPISFNTTFINKLLFEKENFLTHKEISGELANKQESKKNTICQASVIQNYDNKLFSSPLNKKKLELNTDFASSTSSPILILGAQSQYNSPISKPLINAIELNNDAKPKRSSIKKNPLSFLQNMKMISLKLQNKSKTHTLSSRFSDVNVNISQKCEESLAISKSNSSKLNQNVQSPISNIKIKTHEVHQSNFNPCFLTNQDKSMTLVKTEESYNSKSPGDQSQLITPKTNLHLKKINSGTKTSPSLSFNNRNRLSVSKIFDNPPKSTSVLDISKIFRKTSEYKNNRDVSLNYQNFIKMKRKMIRFPSIAKFSDKFDMNSPYHPIYFSILDFNNLALPCTIQSIPNIQSLQSTILGNSSSIYSSTIIQNSKKMMPSISNLSNSNEVNCTKY